MQLSKALTPAVHDSFQLPHVMGSDHCPVGLTLKVADLPEGATQGGAPAAAAAAAEADERENTP